MRRFVFFQQSLCSFRLCMIYFCFFTDLFLIIIIYYSLINSFIDIIPLVCNFEDVSMASWMVVDNFSTAKSKLE